MDVLGIIILVVTILSTISLDGYVVVGFDFDGIVRRLEDFMFNKSFQVDIKYKCS
jgi:hypothetical protein